MRKSKISLNYPEKPYQIIDRIKRQTTQTKVKQNEKALFLTILTRQSGLICIS